LRDKIINTINKIAAESSLKKTILTPVIAGIFTAVTYLFGAVPVYLDRIYGNPAFIRAPLNYIFCMPLLIAGIVLMVWTSMIFLASGGTPVPVNPPQRLITTGPYAYSRNPMHTGLFLIMFASGIYFGSLLSVLVFTPIYILMDTLIFKYIEEPELEKRLGEKYVEYKKRTPMFFPRVGRITP
jgi:protein-S-isoprenylcysteine O-methyltransferase Ste14